MVATWPSLESSGAATAAIPRSPFAAAAIRCAAAASPLDGSLVASRNGPLMPGPKPSAISS